MDIYDLNSYTFLYNMYDIENNRLVNIFHVVFVYIHKKKHVYLMKYENLMFYLLFKCWDVKVLKLISFSKIYILQTKCKKSIIMSHIANHKVVLAFYLLAMEDSLTF